MLRLAEGQGNGRAPPLVEEMIARLANLVGPPDDIHRDRPSHADGRQQIRGAGLGLTSGAAFSFHEVINATDHGRDGTARVSSGNDTEVLHGEGSVPDLFFRQHYQFAVNANGDVTVDFNDIESICS